MTVSELLEHQFPTSIIDSHNHYGDETVVVDRNNLIAILQFLKNDPRTSFDLFLDLCGVDYPERKMRFEVVYHLYSLKTHQRLRLKVCVPESDPVLPSVMTIWEAADWFEREAYDMFGLHFDGHPKLKRLLMWEEFEGYPLRKDYPMDKRQPIPEPADIV